MVHILFIGLQVIVADEGDLHAQNSTSAGVEMFTKMYKVGKRKGKCRNCGQDYVRN